jgi:YD repeat-containing protein
MVELEVTGEEIVIPSTNGIYIDELRLHPTDAVMTTYTYLPLIGITSITDPRNSTSYYDYNDFGKLKTIKDEDGNILETYEYNYASEDSF